MNIFQKHIRRFTVPHGTTHHLWCVKYSCGLMPVDFIATFIMSMLKLSCASDTTLKMLILKPYKKYCKTRGTKQRYMKIQSHVIGYPAHYNCSWFLKITDGEYSNRTLRTSCRGAIDLGMVMRFPRRNVESMLLWIWKKLGFSYPVLFNSLFKFKESKHTKEFIYRYYN